MTVNWGSLNFLLEFVCPTCNIWIVLGLLYCECNSRQSGGNHSSHCLLLHFRRCHLVCLLHGPTPHKLHIIPSNTVVLHSDISVYSLSTCIHAHACSCAHLPPHSNRGNGNLHLLRSRKSEAISCCNLHLIREICICVCM